MSGWAVIRAGEDTEETAEAWGPFSSRVAAEKFCEDFGEYVNPGYAYLVVELFPVRDGLRAIREDKRADAEEAYR